MPCGCRSLLPESITFLCVPLKCGPAGGPGDCPLWFGQTGSSCMYRRKMRGLQRGYVAWSHFINSCFIAGTQCAFMEISVLEGVLIKRKGCLLECCFLLCHFVTICKVHVKNVLSLWGVMMVPLEPGVIKPLPAERCCLRGSVLREQRGRSRAALVQPARGCAACRSSCIPHCTARTRVLCV